MNISLFTLAYPSVVFLCCLSFFCDEHLFGGSKCGCCVRGTSRGWKVIF